MHLLQAGVDISVIALWLGHESPVTTHQYIEAETASPAKGRGFTKRRTHSKVSISLWTRFSPEGRAAVQAFLASGQLADPIGPAFVKALQEILSGLERVVLTEPRLLSALTDGGAPCTVAEIKQRFEGFVAELTKGKDVARVRFVIEKDPSKT